MKNVLEFSGTVLLCCSLPATAATISIEPPATTAPLGGEVSLNVDVSGLSDLFAFQFDVVFNPAALEAISVTEGALFSGIGVSFSPGFIDNTTGNITSVLDSLGGPGVGTNSAGTLAQINLKTLAVGSSGIELTNVILLDSSLNEIAFTANAANVTASRTVVPEPTTFSLVLVALSVVGLVAGACRKWRSGCRSTGLT
jgi:hypothetical protein